MFPCTSCGCCCKRINKIVEGAKELHEKFELPDEIKEFPYAWDETGRCEKLSNDNKCTVYDNRPLICNMDKLYKAMNIPKDVFYGVTIAACNKLMDEDNVDANFKII